MSEIKTWQERKTSELLAVVVDVMQAEIDELRAALAERAQEVADRNAEIARLTLGWNAANRDALHHAMTIAAQRAKLAVLEGQAPFDDWPEYHHEAMGCGLEDRNIRDRYEAMQYGWDQALDRVAERLEGYPAAGAAPVPTDAERSALIKKLRRTDWTISAADLANLCTEAATMLAAAPKEPT